MKEFIILLVGILLLSILLMYKEDKKRFVELYKNDDQVYLDNVEQIIFYKPYTLPDGIKEQLKSLINTILTDLNNVSESKYYPGEYESVVLERAKNGDKRYIIDMIIFDINEHYDIRILLDVVNKNKTYHLNNIRMVNADSETSASLMREIYGVNVDHVIDTNNRTNCDKANLDGSETSTLEMSLLKKGEGKNYLVNPGVIRNKWLLDKNISKLCDAKTKKQKVISWDKYSILKNDKSNEYLYYPTNNPTITGLPHHEKDPNSIFYRARGIISF